MKQCILKDEARVPNPPTWVKPLTNSVAFLVDTETLFR